MSKNERTPLVAQGNTANPEQQEAGGGSPLLPVNSSSKDVEDDSFVIDTTNMQHTEPAESKRDYKMLALRIFLFAGCALSQAVQNVCLPLALGGGDSMAVVLVYTAFVYMIFFSVVDVMLDPICHLMKVPHHDRHIGLHDPRLMIVGLFGSLNGVGAVFGGSAKRTPLPLQMGIMMVANLLAARFKIWSFNIKLPWCGKTTFHKWFWSAWGLYLMAFACILIDRMAIANTKNGSIDAFCLFFVGGALMIMFYNVQQDKCQAGIDISDLSFLAYFKQSVSLLRRQTTWLFVWNWIGVLVAMIPGVDQSGEMNSATFDKSWAEFLPFTNLYMNLFNVGYIASFLFAVFLNKIDSSLTMTAFNVSAVLAIAAGWLPDIGMKVTGYVPNVPLTVAAIVLALVGMYPSEKYSKELRNATAEIYLTEDEKSAVISHAIASGRELPTSFRNVVDQQMMQDGARGGSSRSLPDGPIQGDLKQMRDSFALGAY